MSKLIHLHVRNAKDDETSVEAATQIFSSLLSYKLGLLKRLWSGSKEFSFEIFLVDQMISFYITADETSESFLSSLVSSSYPASVMTKTEDPMTKILETPKLSMGEMVLNSYYYLPIKTYTDFSDVDPLASLVGFMARQPEGVSAVVQLLVSPAAFKWQDAIIRATQPKKTAEGEVESQTASKSLMIKKAAFAGGKGIIRVAIGGANHESSALLHNLAGTFGAFAMGEGNQLELKKPKLGPGKLRTRLLKRTTSHMERKNQIFNAQELATLWHPPGLKLAGIKNISWGKTLKGEAPANLPVAQGMSDEEKESVNFFAKTEFRNQFQIFGIKTDDRRKHIYAIGKTGAGKSTLIANMAIDDIRAGRGIGVIDPHGDLCEAILDYIPNRRVNDVVYLEPFDTDRPFSLNVLEVKNKQHKDLVASGIVAIFSKLYANSWGPRLEYILRNTIITLLEIPGATLIDALRLLSEQDYRRRAIEQIQDPVIKNFWVNEFNQMSDKLRTEAVSPIQNKVGQFVSSQMVRNIVGTSKSTINLEDIMNEGKILLLNLSQGKLGEDNAALLGAMTITQIQLAAMNRAFQAESDRKDFFLYVDEFQNFSTKSFIKILSEARKYRLSLTLANQYINQLDIEIQKAIFGNAGTLVSFVVGAEDARSLAGEYGGIYTENDLVSLGKFETVMKLSIDGMTSMPFPAITLPPPQLKNNNREKIKRLSKEKYGRKVKVEPNKNEPVQGEDEAKVPENIVKAEQSPKNSEKHHDPKPEEKKQPQEKKEK